MHARFLSLSRLMAYLGGVMLTVLILLTCASIVGRQLNGIFHDMISAGVLAGAAQFFLDLGIGPINGDFELIEAGIAFSIFAFMPLCQITGGHASVDVFTTHLSRRTNTILRLVTDIAFAFVLLVIAVQLYHGMQSKISSGQTTFLIEFPIWWAYALSLVGAVVAALVGVYVAGARIAETMTGKEIIPDEMGAEH